MCKVRRSEVQVTATSNSRIYKTICSQMRGTCLNNKHTSRLHSETCPLVHLHEETCTQKQSRKRWIKWWIMTTERLLKQHTEWTKMMILEDFHTTRHQLIPSATNTQATSWTAMLLKLSINRLTPSLKRHPSTLKPSTTTISSHTTSELPRIWSIPVFSGVITLNSWPINWTRSSSQRTLLSARPRLTPSLLGVCSLFQPD